MPGEVSRSYEGPADVEERFEKLLDKWREKDGPELAECNDLRIAFHLGKESADQRQCSEGKEKTCSDFYCDKHAGTPAEIPEPICQRCEGTGVMKVIHLDADGKPTGQHEMYCPDGCPDKTEK